MENFFTPRFKLVFVLLLLIIAISSVFTATNRGNASITVIGQGSLLTKPGQVSMVVTRATLANDADEAVAQGEIAMTKIIDSARKIGGNNIEIKKSFYQITPQNDGKFLMANAISIKSNNVALAGNLIKFLYANGATTISNVSFTPADESSDNQTREIALKDAKKKATDLAKIMGKKVGKILSIVEDSTNLSSSVGDANSTGSDIGQINIEKRISVVYEVK